MHYRVYADDVCIHDSNTPEADFKVLTSTLSLEDSKAGSFDFSLSRNNPGYDSIDRLTTDITVYQNGIEIWAGRVLQEDISIDKVRSLYCEGELSFLNDTCQPQREYKEYTPDDIMDALLDVHNNRVDTRRKFYWDRSNSPFPNEQINFTTQYESTLDVVYRLMGAYGAHVHIEKRVENGVKNRYLVFTNDATYENNLTQTIQFGKNLVDYTGSYDLSQIATVLVPLGKKISGAGQNLIGDVWDPYEVTEHAYLKPDSHSGEPQWHDVSSSSDSFYNYQINEYRLNESEMPTENKDVYLYITSRANNGATMYAFWAIPDTSHMDWWQFLDSKEAGTGAGVTDILESQVKLPVGTRRIRVCGMSIGELKVRVNNRLPVSDTLDDYTTVADVNDGSVYVVARSINLFRSAIELGSFDEQTGEQTASSTSLISSTYLDVSSIQYTMSAYGGPFVVDIFYWQKDWYGSGFVDPSDEDSDAKFTGIDLNASISIGSLTHNEIDSYTGADTQTTDSTAWYTTGYTKLTSTDVPGTVHHMLFAKADTDNEILAYVYLYTKSGDNYIFDSAKTAEVNANGFNLQQTNGDFDPDILFSGDDIAYVHDGSTVYYARFKLYYANSGDIGDIFSEIKLIYGYIGTTSLMTTKYVRVGKGSLSLANRWSTTDASTRINVLLYTLENNIYTYDQANSDLINYNSGTARDYGFGDTITIPENRYARFQFSTTGLTSIGFAQYKNYGDYELIFDPTETSLGNTLYFAFTPPGDRVARFRFRSISSSTLSVNSISDIQLELGSLPHAYESPIMPLERYGWYERQVTWDDVDDPQILYDRAIKYLKSGQFDTMSIEISAIDLALLGANVDAIKLGQRIRVVSPMHGLDSYFDVTAISYNISDVNTTYTLGKTQTYTISASTNAINSQLQSLIGGDKRNVLLAEAMSVGDSAIKSGMCGYVTTIIDPDTGIQAAHFYSDIPVSSPYTTQWTAADRQAKGVAINKEGIGFYGNGYENEPTIAIVNQSGMIVGEAILAESIVGEKIAGGTLKLGRIEKEDGSIVDGEIRVYASSGENRPIMTIDKDKFELYDKVTAWPNSKPRWIKMQDGAIRGGDVYEGSDYWDGTIYPNFSWGNQFNQVDCVGVCVAAQHAIGFSSPRILVRTDGGAGQESVNNFTEAGSNSPVFVGDVSTSVRVYYKEYNVKIWTGNAESWHIVRCLGTANDNDGYIDCPIDVTKYQAQFINGFYINDGPYHS